jgi:hypothetical protein
VREKYCWLVADKPNEQGDSFPDFYDSTRIHHRATDERSELGG